MWEFMIHSSHTPMNSTSLSFHILLQPSPYIYGLNHCFWFLLKLSPSGLLFLKPLILDSFQLIFYFLPYASPALEILFLLTSFPILLISTWSSMLNTFFVSSLSSDSRPLKITTGSATRLLWCLAFSLTEPLPFALHWIKTIFVLTVLPLLIYFNFQDENGGGTENTLKWLSRRKIFSTVWKIRTN